MIQRNIPRVSFVVTGRNDDYGGNFLNRIGTWLRVVCSFSALHKLSTELIIVEYNPPPDKKRLHQELAEIERHNVPVRFIHVPQEFHRTRENSSKNPLFEFVAKNIGIRRATGEYIIAMNPDIVVSEDLIAFIANGLLKEDTFYRVNRHDISLFRIDTKISARDAERICSQKTTKILLNGGTLYTSYQSWFSRFIHGRTIRSFLYCPLFNFINRPKKDLDNAVLHGNAAGDFLMMHRDMWEKSGGYDEAPLGSAFLDSYLLYVLFCFDYHQEISPYPIYHIEHHYGKSGRPIMEQKRYREETARMLETKKLSKPINTAWGFPELDFQEVRL